MFNTPDGQFVQVIAVPAGAAPPEGAVFVGPSPPQHSAMAEPMPEEYLYQHMGGAGKPWSNQIPMPPAHAPPNMQMIAVPVGEAPPAGAIPVGPLSGHGGQPAGALEKSLVATTAFDQFSTSSTAASTPLHSPGRQNKAFKILDPKTGRRIEAASSDGSSPCKRVPIVNPKTGEEVQASA
jgi:hypothetical protein